LYIGGAGLARGYTGRAELTAEKFIAHPFRVVGGERLYRSGDLVRWRGTGELEFIGRIDEQVKVRGYRIELGEVETVLRQHPEVSEAVVVVREGAARDQQIVAYIVSEDGAETPIGELRMFLKEQLPEYMIPAAFVRLDELPLTTSGKINRKDLPSPDGPPVAAETFVAPRTQTEEVIAKIWADVMQVESVGVHDDFFALGGHSLIATQMISRLRENFALDVPLRSIFETLTVARLAVVIETMQQRTQETHVSTDVEDDEREEGYL
jgi:acyl carrier protein